MRNVISASLDDPETYARFDPESMLGYIEKVPELCEKAWQSAMSFELPDHFRKADKVVVLGMGGSAIGGDLVSSLVTGESKVPIILCRDYHIPGFVDDKTLVIASSYSGGTEETLSAFSESLKIGARNLAITHGGKLLNIAKKANVPVFYIDHESQPRAALPFSIMPILCFLQKLGFIGDKSEELAETVDLLGKLSAELAVDTPLSDNTAKQLASRLHGRIAIIYGAEHLSQTAHRWKAQINENAKAWAIYDVFSELNHNSVVGYEFPKEVAKKLFVILLYSPNLGERVKLRYSLTCELLENAKIGYEYAESRGESRLCQMMSTVLLGDYVSYYLAMLNGVDPMPAKAIDYLKEVMGKIPFGNAK